MLRVCCRLLLVVALAVLSVSPDARGSETGALPPAGGAGEAGAPPAPDVGTLAPRAAELSRRYAQLESQLRGRPDFSSTRKSLEDWQGRIARLETQLEALKALGESRTAPLSQLRASAREASDALTEILATLTTEMSQLASLQREWTGERSSWEAWQESLRGAGTLGAWEPVFSESLRTAEKALALIATAQPPILRLERWAGELQGRTIAIDADGAKLLETLRGRLFRRTGPSILSPKFARALRGPLLTEFWRNLSAIAWPGRSFFAANGWVVLLQVALVALLCRALLQRRALLGASERWAFLQKRPVAAGLFVGAAAPSPLYGALPPTWALLLWTVVAPAAARLVAGFITLPWKRRLLYSLAALFWAFQLLRVAGMPEPLFRICVAAVAAVGLPLALWRAHESVKRRDTPVYTWALRIGALVFAVVLVAQVGGYSALATHLLESSIKTTFLVLIAWLLALLLRGGVDFALRHPILGHSSLLAGHAAPIGRRAGTMIDLVVGALTLGGLLEVWGAYDTPMGGLGAFLSAELAIGGYRLTLGVGLLALALLYGAFVTSWAIQTLLMEGTFLPTQLEPGVRISVGRLIHYALVLLGFSLALGALGIDLRNLTILAGAFGVGIGFGLQNIVNNFVSGLILLFERPVKVGDIVQVGGEWGQIKSLGLRSTVIRTYDQSEIIVPNSDLVSNQVTNWTLTDRQARVVVPVGVAYGSDVPKVMGILSEVADKNPAVLRDPERQILFRGFGDSSLDFELRVWIADVMERLVVLSDLLQAIDRRFREEGVEIPFPQRDLHLRSVDAPAAEALAGQGPSCQPPGEASASDSLGCTQRLEG